MKKANKNKKSKKSNGLMNLIDGIGDSLLAADISIKINNHEISKDSKNNLSYVMTKDNIRTAIHYHDKRFGFARIPVENTTNTDDK